MVAILPAPARGPSRKWFTGTLACSEHDRLTSFSRRSCRSGAQGVFAPNNRRHGRQAGSASQVLKQCRSPAGPDGFPSRTLRAASGPRNAQTGVGRSRLTDTRPPCKHGSVPCHGAASPLPRRPGQMLSRRPAAVLKTRSFSGPSTARPPPCRHVQAVSPAQEPTNRPGCSRSAHADVHAPDPQARKTLPHAPPTLPASGPTR
jgi:hypothetical protein